MADLEPDPRGDRRAHELGDRQPGAIVTAEAMADKVWIVYVLLSHAGARTYVGITTDPDRRTAQHNGELVGGAKATRAGRPWRIGAIYGPYAERGLAQRVEAQVKRLRGRLRLAWTPANEFE